MEYSKQMKILPFSPEYQKGVIDLIVGIQQKEFKIDITADNQPDLHNIPDYYQKDNGNFWVAVIKSRVIGTISLLDIGNKQAALRKMFVNNEYRGAKYDVAFNLLETLLKWAGSRNLKQIYLGTTPKFLAAHRFYEKNEFIEIEKSELPERFPVMEVDTKFYKYSL